MSMFGFEDEKLIDPEELKKIFSQEDKSSCNSSEQQLSTIEQYETHGDIEPEIEDKCHRTTRRIVVCEVVLILLLYVVLYSISDILILFAIIATPILIAIFNIVLGIVWFQYRYKKPNSAKRAFIIHLVFVFLTFVLGWSYLNSLTWM